MINRRRAIATLVTAPMIAKSLLADSIRPEFEEVFTPVGFKNGELPEFPLEFIHPVYNPGELKAWIHNHNSVWKLSGDDYILVPTPFNKKHTALDSDYGAVLFAAAINRNIILFDEQCNKKIVSTRIVSLMKQTIKRMGGNHRYKMTDLFYREDAILETNGCVTDLYHHRVKNEVWDAALKGLYYSGVNDKNTLVLGVCRNDCLVKPILNEEESGIAVLNNKTVVLGVY